MRKETVEQRRVLSPAAAFLVSDILSDRESRSRTFSLESPLSTRFWSAVKTGTSKDMRDNWCVGYSDRYTVGVWVGNFSGEPMWNVSGVTGAAPVWLDVMNWLHRGSVSVPPAPPAGLVSRTVEMADFGRVRREWFLQGTESPVVSAASVHAHFRISYPAAGTVIALDPDIPAASQKVFFEAEPGGCDLGWLLDGEPAGSADSLVLWSPLKGKHRLALVDRTDRILDSVEFEVRGIPFRCRKSSRSQWARFAEARSVRAGGATTLRSQSMPHAEVGALRRKHTGKDRHETTRMAQEDEFDSGALRRRRGFGHVTTTSPAGRQQDRRRSKPRSCASSCATPGPRSCRRATTATTSIVRLTCGDVTGRGEGAPIVRYNENADCARRAVESVSQLVGAADPWQFEKLMAEVFRRIPGEYAAKAAIDIALMDWVGQKLGVPLYRYFGLDRDDAPVTTFSIGIDTPEITRQKVREAEQFPILKIKVGLARRRGDHREPCAA